MVHLIRRLLRAFRPRLRNASGRLSGSATAILRSRRVIRVFSAAATVECRAVPPESHTSCPGTGFAAGLARSAGSRVWPPAALTAVLGWTFAPDLRAQSGTTTGVIRGEVHGPLGVPLPGAVVVIRHRDTDLSTEVETDGGGTFIRPLLPPGVYDLTVAAADPSYGTERIEGAVLRVGGVLDLHLELRIVAAETVTVFGELPSVIETTNVTRSQRIAGEVADSVPSNGRNYLDLVLLTPGALGVPRDRTAMS